MGLAQEVAYSSLLAFFPAVIALVGLLDLINAYGALRSFLDPVAPHAVMQLIDSFQRDSGGSGSVFALVIGSDSGRLGGVGSDGLGRQGGQPHLRPDGDEAVLEGEADLDLPRARLGARDRGNAALDRARRHARRRDLAADAQRQLHLGLEHSPLADRVRRGAAPVRVDLLPRRRTPTSGAGAGSRPAP